MSDWKEKIEAQIASLRAVPRHHVPIAYWEMCCRAADDMQALLDVAVAADAVLLIIDRDQVDVNRMRNALDKLREVSDGR